MSPRGKLRLTARMPPRQEAALAELAERLRREGWSKLEVERLSLRCAGWFSDAQQADECSTAPYRMLSPAFVIPPIRLPLRQS